VLIRDKFGEFGVEIVAWESFRGKKLQKIAILYMLCITHDHVCIWSTQTVFCSANFPFSCVWKCTVVHSGAYGRALFPALRSHPFFSS